MASTSTLKPVFPDLPRFREGLAALSTGAVAAGDRFSTVLGRAISALPCAGAAGGASAGNVIGSSNSAPSLYAFTVAEEAQLCTVLSLDASSCRLALETAAFIFERCAGAALKPAAVLAALETGGLSEAAASSFAAVWAADGPALVSRLRAATLGTPLVLAGTAWRTQLGLGSSAETRGKAAAAVLDFELVRPGGGGAADPASFSVQLSREELLEVFNKLDRVQSQLDELTA